MYSLNIPFIQIFPLLRWFLSYSVIASIRAQESRLSISKNRLQIHTKNNVKNRTYKKKKTEIFKSSIIFNFDCLPLNFFTGQIKGVIFALSKCFEAFGCPLK